MMELPRRGLIPQPRVAAAHPGNAAPPPGVTEQAQSAKAKQGQRSGLGDRSSSECQSTHEVPPRIADQNLLPGQRIDGEQLVLVAGAAEQNAIGANAESRQEIFRLY